MLIRLLILSAWLLEFCSISLVALAGDDAGSGRETPADRIVVAAESVAAPTGGSRDSGTESKRPRVVFITAKETLVSHLRGPVHGPQLAASYQIETWSVEKLRSLHDDLHEIEMGGAVPTGYATPQPARAGFSSSSATNKFNGKF